MKSKIYIESVERGKSGEMEITADFINLNDYMKFAKEYGFPVDDLDAPTMITIIGKSSSKRVRSESTPTLDFSGCKVTPVKDSCTICAKVEFNDVISFI